ncbi:MAG TPA: YetF domain-containing protein [Longimicrobiales bacterium]|nr:YetF domain-containing protein [Longimicrobiales bacterium]
MTETLDILGSGDPNWWQAVVRAMIVYAVALVLVRVGEKRALGKNTALDVVVAVMLGSVVSRGITSVGLAVGLLGGAMLVFLHWLLSVVTFHSDRLGTLLKGSPRVLVKDGEIDWSAMKESHISRDDLLAALRSESQLDDVDSVRVARLERSGQISAIERDREKQPRVLSVDVAAGVQTVRIELT